MKVLQILGLQKELTMVTVFSKNSNSLKVINEFLCKKEILATCYDATFMVAKLNAVQIVVLKQLLKKYSREYNISTEIEKVSETYVDMLMNHPTYIKGFDVIKRR